MKIISIPTIAKQFGKDSSQVRKDIKKKNLTLYDSVTSKGKSCTAITFDDFAVLKTTSSYSYKVYPELPKGAITLDQATEESSMDKSGLQKKAKALGMVLDKAYVKGFTKPVRFFTKKQWDTLCEKYPLKLTAD